MSMLSQSIDNEKDPRKSWVDKEQIELEREIVKIILSRKIDLLKPNYGQAVTIREHYICVWTHEQKDPDCLVWEWHGHIMTYDPQKGYMPEYIYGHYYERYMSDEMSDAIDEQLEELWDMEFSKERGG